MTELSRMACAEVFRRLNDYLDHELSAAEIEQVEAHLRTCEECAREYAFEAGVLQDIRARLRRSKAPDTLRAAILKVIDDTPTTGESGN
jgi:anti-sigma factor (TIGR02949 family)